jgi:PKHD-type hydroxylase
MLLEIANVFEPSQLRLIQERLTAADWSKGRLTETSVSESLGEVVAGAVRDNSRFLSAALPLKVFPPQFYRSAKGEGPPTTGVESIRSLPRTGDRLRADLSAVVFLTDPGEYEGGEYVVEAYGSQTLRLPAGRLLLYPSSGEITSRVVTKGVAFSCVFWIQSLIRDERQRKILFDMDSAIQQLTSENPDHLSTLRLAGVYQDLLRYWAQT